jgi:CRISPR-associated protein Csx10
LTARTCKLYPGYDAGDGKTYHGVYDAMLDQFVYGLLSDPEYPMRDRLQPALEGTWADLKEPLDDACPVCGQALTPAEGTYVHGEGGVPGYAGRVSVRRATHVGINRARAVAEDGLLFTLETIEPLSAGALFHAQVVTPQACAAVLREHLEGEGYVGRGRSRGLGRVELWVHQEREPGDGLARRLENFERAVNSVLAPYTSQDRQIEPSLPGALFSVTLRSPAILESFGRPLARLNPEKLGLPEVALLQAWARTEVVTGWDGAARLQRRTRLGLQAGSVFLYWIPPEADRESATRQLKKIELEGVGEERARGYGQVAVCAPFHVHHRLGDAQRERSEP